MKRRIVKLLIAAAAGATVFHSCLSGGNFLKFLGDFVGDEIWLRVVD
jgi:hypothetical protein